MLTPALRLSPNTTSYNSPVIATNITRRGFIAAAATAVTATAFDASNYRVGITTNTRGGWEKDVFLSFREAREAGYRNVESFVSYFLEYLDRPEALLAKTDEIGVRFVTISNNAPLEMHFEDAAKRDRIVADHMRLVRLLNVLGCDHLKINSGNRRPGGTTDDDLKAMAATYNELGRRVSGAGLKFGIHAHMWSQFENTHEIDWILDRTDPQHVWFVLDTGHVTMAGVDPLALTKKLGRRIIEFHLKDVEARYRGGARQRFERNDPMRDPLFFELGSHGGVDFPGLIAYLNEIEWKGWLTVELDSSPYRPPKDSAILSRRYLEDTLHIPVS